MKKYSGILIAGLIFIIGVLLATRILTHEKKLKIFNPIDVNPVLVDDSLKNVAKNHRVSQFALSDQQGLVTDASFLKDKIYVADFFFTTCQTICPVMQSHMNIVADVFKEKKDVKFISFSVTPQIDTVPVLRAYAEQLGINYDQWRLLTGDKKKIYDLARKSYFALKPAETGKGDGGVSDFIHTNNFVLVDKNKRIRGYYDGTSSEDIERLIEEVNILLDEKTTE